MKFQGSYVYIITNKQNGTLYTGVTSDLKKRIWEHKEGVVEGFSKKYGLKILVWYEVHDDINEAIKREKQIKKWERKWKLRIIEEMNTGWADLYNDLNK
ncbi:MAG: excinuclease ABC subunit C [Micavibrio sp.]|nr:MAG: excinuclease ABC subunit C [Micavibrio sp.]